MKSSRGDDSPAAPDTHEQEIWAALDEAARGEFASDEEVAAVLDRLRTEVAQGQCASMTSPSGLLPRPRKAG